MNKHLISYLTGVMMSVTVNCQSDHAKPSTFVDIQDLIPDLVVDLRYFSNENFVGSRIDGYEASRCFLTEAAANALKKVQDELREMGLGLKIYDCYRPQQAVDHFRRWVQDTSDTVMKSHYYPDIEKKALLEEGYISEKSGHSRGSTVDLTIVSYHSGGPRELDMGSHWDLFSPLSWPDSQAVNATQQQNRQYLQKIMDAAGFDPFPVEWWHFTLRNEPFPDTYFNFPIK